jgi:hypothetical protein
MWDSHPFTVFSFQEKASDDIIEDFNVTWCPHAYYFEIKYSIMLQYYSAVVLKIYEHLTELASQFEHTHH